MSTPPLTLPDRLKTIRERMNKAAEKSGRTGEDIVLVAVGKTISAEVLSVLPDVGVRNLGENKIQEALAKRPFLPNGLIHHFIGHLQTNKARKAVELFDLIQTVDSPRLAETLDRIAGEMGKHQRCLIEIKVSSEPTKSGVPINDAPDFIRGFQKYAHLKLDGLMTIGPNEQSLEGTRECFRHFSRFCTEQKSYLGETPVFSYGMSDDFDIAIEEGSNMVRVGRALFGDRKA